MQSRAQITMFHRRAYFHGYSTLAGNGVLLHMAEHEYNTIIYRTFEKEYFILPGLLHKKTGISVLEPSKPTKQVTPTSASRRNWWHSLPGTCRCWVSLSDRGQVFCLNEPVASWEDETGRGQPGEDTGPKRNNLSRGWQVWVLSSRSSDWESRTGKRFDETSGQVWGFLPKWAGWSEKDLE